MVGIFSILRASASLLLLSQYVLAQGGFDPTVVPDSCKDDCQPMTDTLSGCSMAWECLCKSSTIDNLRACLTCVPSTGVTPQSVIDKFGEACSGAGHPIGSSSGGSTTPSASATASAAGSSPSSPNGTSSGSSTRNCGALVIVALGATLLFA